MEITEERINVSLEEPLVFRRGGFSARISLGTGFVGLLEQPEPVLSSLSRSPRVSRLLTEYFREKGKEREVVFQGEDSRQQAAGFLRILKRVNPFFCLLIGARVLEEESEISHHEVLKRLGRQLGISDGLMDNKGELLKAIGDKIRETEEENGVPEGESGAVLVILGVTEERKGKLTRSLRKDPNLKNTLMVFAIRD